MSFRCLCCNQLIEKRRTDSISDVDAARALYFLERLGYTRDGLRTEHRANIDWCRPGFSAWLDRDPIPAASALNVSYTEVKPTPQNGKTL